MKNILVFFFLLNVSCGQGQQAQKKLFRSNLTSCTTNRQLVGKNPLPGKRFPLAKKVIKGITV